jgi:hypothetical protein
MQRYGKYLTFSLFPLTLLCIFNNLALTHLVLGILLVDNEQATLAAYNLAVGSALLQ